jgi:hypothetical protein
MAEPHGCLGVPRQPQTFEKKTKQNKTKTKLRFSYKVPHSTQTAMFELG